MKIKKDKNCKKIYKNIKITAEILTKSASLTSSGSLFHSWALV